MPFVYQSGETIMHGDRVLYGGNPGEIEFVIDPEAFPLGVAEERQRQQTQRRRSGSKRRRISSKNWLDVCLFIPYIGINGMADHLGTSICWSSWPSCGWTRNKPTALRSRQKSNRRRVELSRSRGSTRLLSDWRIGVWCHLA